ncbi:MAG: proline--tRNA ligase [Deltaproteobacteria bacterium]|nr:proline--tRNA ligase [Deltaproteobacteria bacterium]
MAKQKHGKTAVSPTREEDYAEWYQQVVRAADLAEVSPVRGCMVIKPWGYALWENMQRVLDGMFKATGHRNAYFPLFIPKSFLEKEASHVEGFAKECAVVTHHRLVAGPSGGLIADPAAQLEEPLIVRPTSETIIGASFAQWVSSYRDLPLLINQWANVVRWELRTRLFLRTTEFLWQEGHTAHASKEEALEETYRMLDVYADFAERYLALPVVKGRKSAAERFPGAVDTLTIEAMVQDRKALQCGTSHFLGQNFAHASGIKFQSAAEKEEYAWTTSWGVSTRLIGALIMTHADDDGLVVPPRLAPAHVVLMPLLRDEASRPKVMAYVDELRGRLREARFDDRPLEIEVDGREMRGGEKGWLWVKRGVPVRVEIGPRDVEAGAVSYARRDRPAAEKQVMARDQFVAALPGILDEIQRTLFERATRLRSEHTRDIDSWADFAAFFTPRDPERPEIHGGFARSGWCGEAACEARSHELKVTLRCIPLGAEHERGSCVACGRPSEERVIFAKAY